MNDWIDAVARREFFVGVAAGAVAAGAVLASPALRRRVPLSLGVAFAVSGTVSVARAVPGAVLVPALGIAAMTAAGYTVAVRMLAPGPGVALALPGAVILAVGLEGGAAWERPALVVTAGVASSLAAASDRRLRWGAPALLVSATGVLVGVPDTEAALAVVGVLVPLTALAVWMTGGNLGGAGMFGGIGFIVWAVDLGSAGRPAALVGGLATLIALAMVPVIPRLTTRRVLVPVFLGIHAVAALVAARVAATRGDAISAGAVVAAIAVVTYAALWFVGRQGRGSGAPVP